MFQRTAILAVTLLLTVCMAACTTGGTGGNQTGSALPAAITTASDVAGELTLPMRPRVALNGKARFLAPDELAPMPLNMLIRRYPDAGSQPALVLSTASGGVVFSLDHTRARPVGDMPLVHSSMSRVYHHSYPDAVWLRDGLARINGRTFAVFELEHGNAPDREHVITCVCTLDGTLLLASLTLAEPEVKRWLPTARRLMDSLMLFGE